MDGKTRKQRATFPGSKDSRRIPVQIAIDVLETEYSCKQWQQGIL